MPMNENFKQLKLNMRGSVKNLIAMWTLRRKLKAMGVDVRDIKGLTWNQVEILVSGDKPNLWQVVNWSKRSEVFMFLNEIVFEFVDA